MDVLASKNMNVKTEFNKDKMKAEAKDTVPKAESKGECLLWVDKHRPTSMSKIIGQQGDKSNAKKLYNWLQNWHKFHDQPAGAKAAGGWNRDDGLNFKSALLSGPPGIGKTTTAQLICDELNFTYVEMNASDARSKKLLDTILGGSSTNVSIEAFQKKNASTTKHCIIMDEVDGMAGNEDRGGIQELLNIIKQTKIPIICICNDRQHPKIRSLANYCFDLRFYKPRIEQVRAPLMSICFKEGVKLTPDLLDQIIIGANFDIRQCIHNLSLWTSNSKQLDTKKTQVDIEKAVKDTKNNIFEACKQIFSPEFNSSKSLIDRMDLFFTDYAIMPLFVEENFLNVVTTNVAKSHKSSKYINALASSIEAICEGDRISKLIRTKQSWSLLPSQAIFSTVEPGFKVTGNLSMPSFPSWFGKNSKQGRVDRILQELQKHMRLKISANKYGVALEYLNVMKTRLSRPLVRSGSDGVGEVIKFMNEYYLSRDDFDTILELATWPGQPDPMAKVDSKVKAAFTRAFNKESHKNPFLTVDIKKLKGSKKTDSEYDVEGDEGAVDDGDEEEGDDDITKDAMVKVGTGKNAKASAKASTAASKTTSAKRTKAADSAPASKKRKT
jgi:replication factor C subunit 1